LAAAESAIASADSAEAKEQAEDAKVKAAAKIAELEAQLAAAEAELIPKYDALAAARQAAAAETARAEAAEAARDAARAPEPVSIFISRKTQRLYVRQASQPILDILITIQDPDLPIGTHVFTAMELAGNGVMQWSVVSLVGRYPEGSKPDLHRPGVPGGRLDQTSTDSPGAKAALDRVVIPQDILDRIPEMVPPRSSLIISDEALSPETGRGTEFVVLMSGEPQGGIKHRRRGPELEVRYERSGQRLPY
jgi:multidrug efflux pump subunit AcrA (membrane-fusion protein)